MDNALEVSTIIMQPSDMHLHFKAPPLYNLRAYKKQVVSKICTLGECLTLDIACCEFGTFEAEWADEGLLAELRSHLSWQYIVTQSTTLSREENEAENAIRMGHSC